MLKAPLSTSPAEGLALEEAAAARATSAPARIGSARIGDEFHDARLHTEPYRFVTAHASNLGRLRDLRDQLETWGAWIYCEKSFFRHWEANLSKCAADELLGLRSAESLLSIADIVEGWFSQPIARRVEVLAHKMEKGHYSEFHNDSPRFGRETHRLNVYLNEDWRADWGGRLRAASSQEPGEDFLTIAPTLGTVMAFEASHRSFHAVEPLAAGTRYSILFYLWHAGNTPEIRTAVLDALDTAVSAHEPELRRRAPVLLEMVAGGGEGNLLEHVVRSASLLMAWRAPEAVALAALLQAVDDTALPGAADEVLSDDVAPATAAAAAQLALSLGRTSASPGSAETEPGLATLRFANLVATLPDSVFAHDRWLAGKRAVDPVVDQLPPPARKLARLLFDHPLPAEGTGSSRQEQRRRG